MAYVFDPSGRPGEVPDEKVEAALKAGYKSRQPSASELQKKEAADQPLQAAGEGFLRGSTMGFMEPLVGVVTAKLEGKHPSQVREEMKARKEENPLAAGAGEIGGVIGTSLATGGGASALAGGGMRGALVEGGLYGMGSMVSEDALENRASTVDRLAAGMAGGALASGVAHGGFQILGKSVSAVTSKFGGGSLKTSLGKLADEAEWRALSESNVKWARQNEPFKEEILKFGREKGIIGRAGAALDKDTAGKAQHVASEYATKIGGQMDDLERLAPLKSNDKMRMGLVNTLEKTLDDEFGMNGVFDEAVNGAKKITERIASEPGLTWPKVWEIQSSLFKDVPVTGLSPASQQVRETLRKGMRDYVFDTVAAGSQLPAGLAGMMRVTGRESRAAMALSKALGTRAQSIESSGGLLGLGSMKSLGAGAMAGFSTGNPLAAVAGAAMETQLRKRGGLMGGAALRAISESRVTNGISRALNNHIGTILATAPEVLGAYRYPLSVAAAKGADALVQEHLRLASSDEGQNYLSTVALQSESPEDVDAAGQRLAVLDALEAATSHQREELDGAVDGLFGSAPGRKSSVGVTMSLKDYDKASASIAEILKDPSAAFEQVPAELRAGAPATASEAAAKLVQIAQFLDTKLPKSPFAAMPPALAPPWQPSPTELDRFNRYREAVEDPARVLKNMSRGLIAPEQVEALQAVYPAMYADLQQKITDRLMMQKKPLPYQQRVALAAIIGPQALGMSPQQVQILQQSQTLAAGAAQSGGDTKQGSDGRQDVDEDQIQTESQKLESR